MDWEKVEKKAEFERRLLETSMKEKGHRWRRRQYETLMNMYCGDLKVWIKALVEWTMREHRIGLHPMMIEGDYEEKRDKIVATLMSALIPLEDREVMGRVGRLRALLGGSPSAWIEGAYKVTDWERYAKGLGCEGWSAQGWAEIVSKTMRGPEEMVVNNMEWYMKTEGVKMTERMRESWEEARFWIEWELMGMERDKIRVPMTRAVRAMVRAWVPRWKMTGWEGGVDLLGLEYRAMAWWAAMGRKWMYENHYDEIWRMEKNLETKIKRGTKMTSMERWRFRTVFLKPLWAVIED